MFEGHIHLPEVSTGLYETCTLFILEEAYNIYGAPKLVKPIGSQLGSKFKFEFTDTVYTSPDVTLVQPEMIDGEMYVTKPQSIEVAPQPISVATSTTNGIHTLGSSYDKDAIQITVALNSNNEGPHFRYLNIIDEADGHLVAQITVYGEATGEDERLATLLSNLGSTLNPQDQFLFKSHDINELAPDWILLNQKRKELLLELGNIKPFVGTYKALLNAIKFFGYNNLTLKEYWLVVDDRSPMFGRLKAFEVPDSTKGSYVSNKLKGIQLPSSTYKKTSRFGLFYKLNTTTSQTDEWDLPIVDEVFDFTPEEVLIKLYGLKSKLQREYLPLQAKIIDIIGEADFYNVFNLNIWNNQNPIQVTSAGIKPRFEIEQDLAYIEDLTKVSTLFTGKGQDFNALTPAQMETLYSDVETFYLNYYDIDRSTFQNLSGNLPIGAPVQLNCTTFDDTWDDANFTWFDAESYINWINWWKRNVYETKWTITGPKGYSQTIIGETADVNQIAVALPYEGVYSVTLEHFDLFGHTSVFRMPDSIEIKLKQLEVYGVYRWMDREFYDWQSSNFKWAKAGGSWGFPQQNDDTVDQEVGTLYLTLDRSNYLHDDSQGVNFSMVRRYADSSAPLGFSETPGPYFWRNLRNHVWNDGKHTWWDATRVGSDLAASFQIIDATAGSVFEITHFDYTTNQVVSGQHTINDDLSSPTNLVDFQNAANDLNASTDPVISKFTYNPVFVDTNNDTIVDECIYILAVGKDYSSKYDFVDVVNTSGSITIDKKINYKAYNPTFNDLQIAESHAEIELLTHMTFSADKSKMPGKLSYRWRLQNTTKTVDDIYYNSKWLTYLFEHKGDYTLELEVTDVNGNTKKLVKNALTIK